MKARQSPKSVLAKGKGNDSVDYTCDQCGEVENWFQLPIMWCMVLCEGAPHSDPGFELHFCGEQCVGRYYIKKYLEGVPA